MSPQTLSSWYPFPCAPKQKQSSLAPGFSRSLIHQNRLVQIAREGASTRVAHLREFSVERRYATLARPGEFDYLALVTESYPQLRRYAPEFLEVFEFRSTPASEELLKAVTLLRELNRRNARRVPEEAPTGFVRQRWEKYVFTKDGIERRFYETCVLSELGKALPPLQRF
jgi:hypothetical protein